MSLALVGPIGIRRELLEKTCQEAVGHSHNYDHTTIVIRGRLQITYRQLQTDGTYVVIKTEEAAQGSAVFIAAEVHHTLKALDDNTQYMCVFSHRDFDGLVTQTYVGNAAAYD